MEKFRERIRLLRLEKNLSYRQLSKLSGISPSALYAYEIGERNPKHAAYEALSDVFNVDIAYLMGETDVRNYYANSIGYNSLAEAYAAGVNIEEALKKIPEEPKLSEDELELLQLIRLMPAEMKAMYKEALRAALKSQGLI
jgi:repressor LexA